MSHFQMSGADPRGPRKALVAFAIALVAVGVIGCSRDRDQGSGIRDQKVTVADPRSLPGPRAQAEITLTPDMIQRAGIKTMAAMKSTATTRLHLPGVVQPLLFRDVVGMDGFDRFRCLLASIPVGVSGRLSRNSM